MTNAQRQSRFAVILAFGLVYFFWGSTYLAIDIAVERIPPALMCGVRFLIAGVFMLAFCGLRGRNIRYNPRQLGQMAMSACSCSWAATSRSRMRKSTASGSRP